MEIPSYFRPNTIYCGDCKNVLSRFPEECVDLIYLDPPFFSNQYYEVIWGDGYEKRAFEDRWKGGIEHYVLWMKERLEQCYRVLKSSATLFLHCDWRAIHYLKVELDKLFGCHNFLNEIIWQFEQGGKSAKYFGRKHHTLLWYAKGKNYTFNSEDVREPYTPHKRSSTGHFGGRMGVDEHGRPYVEKWGTGRKKLYRYYLDRGKIPEDVWRIQSIQAGAKERLGYPTQKPEALLERVVKVASNPTDIVLDPFCGCGTAIAVAHTLGRRWVGIDVSPTACNLMVKRMRSIGATPQLVGMPMTEDELRKLQPFEFQNWVIQRLFGRVSSRKSSDMGIDGYTFEGHPVQVKQSEDVGRNVIDNFETALRRVNKNIGVIVAFSFGKGSYEEIARAKLHDGLTIKPLVVADLLKIDRELPEFTP